MSEFIKFNGFEVCDAKAREEIEKRPILENLIVFGDSWSDLNVSDAVWSNLVANRLHLNLNNYASNGAGFIHPTTNLIETQVNTFIESDIVKESVKYIVIMGGINDYRNNIQPLELAYKIEEHINTLSSLCPNAKILYVSNCQYPYTREQSKYWYRLHNYLSTTGCVSSINLDGIIGINLYNSQNYFHLSSAGSKWLARNIICGLTGGEILAYQDERVIENDEVKVLYSTLRVKNIIMVSTIISPKVAKTSYDLSFDGIGISYAPSSFGGFGYGINNIQFGTSVNGIAIRGEKVLDGANYYLGVNIPIDLEV